MVKTENFEKLEITTVQLREWLQSNHTQKKRIFIGYL
jgi:hypothetical protein